MCSLEVATMEDCRAGFLTSSSSGLLSWRDFLLVCHFPPSLLTDLSWSLCLSGGPPQLYKNPCLSNKLPCPLPPPGPERASNLAWMGLISFVSCPVSLQIFSSTFLRLSLAFFSCSCKVLTTTFISLQQASKVSFKQTFLWCHYRYLANENMSKPDIFLECSLYPPSLGFLWSCSSY